MSDGIGIANLPNQVRRKRFVYQLSRVVDVLPTEAQDRRKARRTLHHYGCR